MRLRNPKRVLTVSALTALAVLGACSLEVNVNTHDHEDDHAPEAPTATTTDGERDAPAARRTVPIPPPPAVDEPSEGTVRDALFRFREEAPPPPPPPPAAPERDLEAEPTFTPFTVAPSIVNRDEVIEAMQSNYPPLLKDAGIGGTVRVYFFIDETGEVKRRLIDRSSGHPALDEAALAVADVYRFSPAKNRAENVPVWVSFPVTFQVR